MNQTVAYAKLNDVKVGAHPSLPDKQGFGRREMKISSVRSFFLSYSVFFFSHKRQSDDYLSQAELFNCFVYQAGALSGFLKVYGMEMHHLKPHGAIYGQMARDLELARAGISACKVFGDKVAFVGMAGTMHEVAAKSENIKFIPGALLFPPISLPLPLPPLVLYCVSIGRCPY